MLIREYRDLATPMRELAEQIEKEIVRYKETHGLEGSGTTMAAAYVSKDALAVVNVGDSRIYRFRGETLTQLTRDHRHPDIGTHRGELYQAIDEKRKDEPSNVYTAEETGEKDNITVILFTEETAV